MGFRDVKRSKNAKDTRIIAIINQKGGVGKSTTAANLGIGLADMGKKVLLIDFDAQGSLTESLGYRPDEIEITVSTMLEKTMNEKNILPNEGILHHDEGVDLMPANIELSGMEVTLVNTMSRELILKDYLQNVRKNYDYILIDCTPSLGMLTVNALTAADSVLIPVQAQYLPIKGLEQLIKTIGRVRKHLNPALEIEGILLTMTDNRTNLSKETSKLLRENYGRQIRIFQSEIPHSVRASETSITGQSIYTYDKNGKAALAYRKLTEEVLENEKSLKKHKTDLLR